MSGFVVTEQVDPLTYDFGQYGKSGTFPEPSSDAVVAFRKTVLGALGQSGVTDIVDEAQKQAETVEAGGLPNTLELLAKAVDAGVAVDDALVDAVATLSGGELAATDINALPFRVKQAFLGWVTGAFLSPEA